ncbi:hypothetical protein N7537_000446 [Penicillium hordei]|uniref:Uncharacterized protein n=1 Tax=Penicillium hordei TaxID=40994 RepID=A0AAD6H7C8_9EURO|nr:uncharacterized protein N7537_000446 [Penicillium hordei]KAJ5615332.1 hypothetical protein N7537_000446 [Penicillium hordei]
MHADDDPKTFACYYDYGCVYHVSNTAFSGLVGCCSSNTCGFESVCYNAAQGTATPSLTLGSTASFLFCTDPILPSCATYTWPGADLTDYVCDTSTFVSNVYIAGAWGEAEDGTILLATQFITMVDNDVMSMHSSSYDASTSVPKPTHQATPTTITQQTASSSGSSGSSTSAGTIAGSVVGGVAGAGMIGADVIFLLWKRRKSHQQDGLNEQGNIQYESSDHVGKGMQQPVEVEANDPVHKNAEAPRSIPHNVSQEAGPNAFIAELPVPDDGKHY